MKLKQKYHPLAIWLGALVIIAGTLLFFESDQLWKLQEKNLFLWSALFLKEQLIVPGGLLTWVGTWFMQFLYFPWLGVLLLCLWWLLLMALIKRTFQIPDRWSILLLIPVAILLLTNMGLGYWIYILKLRGHFFVTTIGTTAVVALLWAFRCLPNKYRLRPIFIFITASLGYPLMGIYGLAAALLMAIWSWRLSVSRTAAIICSCVAILSIAVVPLCCYRFIYYQTNFANLLWAELPLFYTTEEYHTYYIPYYLLALFFVILALTYKSDSKLFTIHYKIPIINSLIALLLIGSVYTFWMKDENFHRELTMQHRIAKLDWMGVLEEAAKQKDEPTRAIVMMRNLALSRLGRQGDDMYLYKNGSKAYAAPFGMRLMIVVGPLMYYQYGLLNYCNRLCMEMLVEFGARVEDYQLLANSALLEGDKPLARKYFGILNQTLFHRDWAQRTEKEREPITHMLHYDNMLGGDKGYTERTLMQQLARSTYAGDPVFLEQCLLATLWTKDIGQFWYHFKEYAKLHPQGPIPRYYQEAAYLYGKIEGRQELERMPFDMGIKENLSRFMTTASGYNSQDMEVVREALYPYFGDTYYFDYYVMNKLAEY